MSNRLRALRGHLRYPLMIVGVIALAVGVAACGGQPTAAPTTGQPTQSSQSKGPGPTAAAVSPAQQAMAAAKGLSGADRETKLFEGAKKEGALVMYTSMNVDDAQAMIDAFKTKYPGIDAKIFRAGPADLYTKVTTEWRAGQYLWDIMDIDPEYEYTLENEGYFAAWDSPVRNELPEKLRAANGMWASIYLNANVLTWNTKLVKPEDAPKKYEDLLDPKWRGKFSLDTADYPWAYYITKVMGQDKGMDFLNKLAANKPVMMTGRTNQTNQLIAGEVVASTALYDYAEISQKKKGAPVDFAYVEPVRVENEPVMLNKNAAHPNAALLFLDWFLGKQGQQTMVARTNRIPVRLDVPPGNESQAAVLKGNYMLVPLDEAGKNLMTIQPIFNKLFGVTQK